MTVLSRMELATLHCTQEKAVLASVDLKGEVRLSHPPKVQFWIEQPNVSDELSMRELECIAKAIIMERGVVIVNEEEEDEEVRHDRRIEVIVHNDEEEAEQSSMYAFPRPNLPTKEPEPGESVCEGSNDVRIGMERESEEENESGSQEAMLPDPLSMLQGTFSFFSTVVSSLQFEEDDEVEDVVVEEVQKVEEVVEQDVMQQHAIEQDAVEQDAVEQQQETTWEDEDW